MSNRIKIAIILFCLLICGSTSFAQQKEPQYVNMDARWQWQASSDGITYIPVCWENLQSFTTETQWVKSAIEGSWQAVANIDFQGWGQCSNNSRGIRILITDTRSNSHIGRYLDGKPNGMELNFTFRNFAPSCQAQNKRESCIKFIAIHEFGHALGLAHEQDRTDSTCNDSRGTGGGWYVTAYDESSVMNYCNPRWNNDGKLSQKDIEGIEIVYGKKTVITRGTVRVANSLTSQQVWENVVMEFTNSDGGSSQLFSLNSAVKEQTKAWNFFGNGVYCFRAWSNTMYTDNIKRRGYGESCYTLENGKTYSFGLFDLGWNPNGYSNLAVNVQPTKEKKLEEIKPVAKLSAVVKDYNKYYFSIPSDSNWYELVLPALKNRKINFKNKDDYSFILSVNGKQHTLSEESSLWILDVDFQKPVYVKRTSWKQGKSVKLWIEYDF